MIRKTARWDGRKFEARGKTELEAMTKLAEKIAAAKAGTEAVGGDMTVDSWFKEWYRTYKEPMGVSGKWAKTYEEKYRLYIRPVIGRMRLKDVRDVHLQRILNGQAGSSYSQIKKIAATMKELFRRARLSRLIPYDPAEELRLPAYTKGERRSITEEERAAILSVAGRHKHGLWILTLLYTGMRPGESAALAWADVDFQRNEIHIHAARESGGTEIKGPKTAAGVRDIPMRPELARRLSLAAEPGFGLVFPGYGGKVADERTMRRWWLSFRREVDKELGAELYRSKIVKSALAPGLTLYCLRHTFCTDLQAAGVPLNVAKELMGHSDISVTANIYTHRNNDLLHISMEKLDENPGVVAKVVENENTKR